MNAIYLSDPIARRSLLEEIRCEFLRLARAPSFVVPTLLFPVMFYVLFGIVLAGGKATTFQAAHYMLGTYCVFGVMAPSLFGFGVTVAMERDEGLLALKRALPMPPANLVLAKLGMAMAFAAIIFALLATVGSTFGGVRLGLDQWLALATVCLCGVLPFCAIGLLLGALLSPQGAPAAINLLYLPMAFLSGLWVPVFLLPKPMMMTAPLWPAYHLAQLAEAAIGQPHAGGVLGHVLVLALYALVAGHVAVRRLARVA